VSEPARAGARLEDADLAAVVVHGRDQGPDYMLEHVVQRLAVPLVAYLLPAAPGNSWYPGRYYDPVESNEPSLGNALRACAAAVDSVRAGGVPVERTVLVGFSQGACLLAEFLARAPAPYGGAALLTGSLMGPEVDETAVGRIDGLDVYMASSRFDSWVDLARVEATALAFERAGARVTLEIGDERDHGIADSALAGVADLLARAARRIPKT
jgi:phospholipase/carboxylesterase